MICIAPKSVTRRYRDVLCACSELWGVTVYPLRGRGGYVYHGEYERWAVFVMLNLSGLEME